MKKFKAFYHNVISCKAITVEVRHGHNTAAKKAPRITVLYWGKTTAWFLPPATGSGRVFIYFYAGRVLPVTAGYTVYITNVFTGRKFRSANS